MSSRGYDAIVTAGGAARRMQGRDKLAVDIGGVIVLRRTISALDAASRIIVVGPRRDLDVHVTWCREEPPGGGPAAAVAAGLHQVTAGVVALVAGDQPMLDAQLVQRLVAVTGEQGAVAVDADDRPQWLCSAWPTEPLRRAGLQAGVSLRDTLGALPWRPVKARGRAVFDCDTDDDIDRVREWVG
jgi:molybdopterin-guanine dinucleotide biosynthesis protein A